MKSINECVEEKGTSSSFSRKESGKRFTVKGNKPFYCEVIKIEGCVVEDRDHLSKCDYLFLTYRQIERKNETRPHKAFYVELKGDEIKKACEQLYYGIYYTKSQVLKYEIVAKVIGTKDFHPNLKSNRFYRDVKKLIKKEIEFHKVHKGNKFHYAEQIDL